MTMSGDYERLYDELSGHREKPPQAKEYDPDDPLGLMGGSRGDVLEQCIIGFNQCRLHCLAATALSQYILSKFIKHSQFLNSG